VATDPRKHLERLLSISLLQLCLGEPCHASLGKEGVVLLRDSTRSLSRMLKLVCFVYFVDLVHLVSFVQKNNSSLKHIKPSGVWHCFFA
jgi:hypothetical protein